ncbi:MAG: hypothetical protein GY810_30355 [Aureispira sp.]|nr:hypothetical protein [Aureispira sp.]
MKSKTSPHIIWTVSLMTVILFSMSSFMFKISWDLQKDENGVQIYTRSIEGWDINEYKATTKVKTTLNKAVEAYRYGANRAKWMSKRATGIKNLKEITKDKIYTYTYADAPWPISDRDQISLVEYSYPKEGVVLATLTCSPDYIPRKSGVIRVARMKCHWLFEDLKNGYVRVTTQAVADPGGSLPTWLINANIISGPHETLSGLKRYLEK